MNYAEIQICGGKKSSTFHFVANAKTHFQFNSILWWEHRQNGQKIHVEPWLSSYE